jgi:hypothetical protein
VADLPVPAWTLHHGDCRDVLPALPAGSFDVVLADPPYPEVDRPYGKLSEAEWWDLMRAVVPEVRRLLKPKGSAVFVLQPNSERAGRMRTWLWDFLAWVGREWGVVQDAYCWNYTALPTGGACRKGLCRSSVKACVWCGPPDCYRDQDAVLLEESPSNKGKRKRAPWKPDVTVHSKGHRRVHRTNEHRVADAAERRGGATPFNLLPLPCGDRWHSGGVHGHTGATPVGLCDWWLRYLCPPGGAVLDPFAGSGTVGLAALRQGRTFVGVDKEAAYVAIARKRLAEVDGPLFAPREVS